MCLGHRQVQPDLPHFDDWTRGYKALHARSRCVQEPILLIPHERPAIYRLTREKLLETARHDDAKQDIADLVNNQPDKNYYGSAALSRQISRTQRLS